jgi:hypothetical protein
MKSIRNFALLTMLILSQLISFSASAQCAMCRTQVESNIDGQGKVVGRGLNDGILYLMSIPYLVLGGFGYMIYKNRKGGTNKTTA